MFSRYFVASVLALGVDVATLYLLMLAFAIGPDVAAAGGYLVGVVVHYWASRRFVFSAGWLDHTRLAEFGAFLATGIGGLLLTFGIVHLLAARLGFPVLAAKGAAVAVSFVVVYLVRASLVFRERA
jgi:putative flippase GtrA